MSKLNPSSGRKRSKPRASLRWRARHVIRYRLPGALIDAEARLRGYCNARSTPGGYRHWRCALNRHHTGEHRWRNYTWDRAGRTTYSPVEGPLLQQPRDRNGWRRRWSW